MTKTIAKKTFAKTSAKTSVKSSTLKGATVKSATTSKKTSARSAGDLGTTSDNTAMGLPLKTWVGSVAKAKAADARSGKRAFLFVFGDRDPKTAQKTQKKALTGHLNKWQMQSALESDADSQSFQGANGPVWIIRGPKPRKGSSMTSNEAVLEKTGYARYRDLTGSTLGQITSYQPEKLIIESFGLSMHEEQGIGVGLEVASYSFQENRGKTRRKLPKLFVKDDAKNSNSTTEYSIRDAAELGLAMNIARHYTNLPGGDLNPRTYAESIEAIFSKSKTVTVDVWEGKKLQDENMTLLMAVGNAAVEGPRLVHMRYRPSKMSPNAKPVALVGKGITFDSGGLDIKPSSGMRLMKKDMGGSAAVVGLMKWAERVELPLPLDAYVSLAENAVAGNAFRPGDVIKTRNGMTVEISNTDAEGRLVLADALDVAVSQTGANKPTAVINVATLTGAIKVGLGTDIGGLFSNSDDLAHLIAECGLERGDFVWRMPLYQPYRSQIKSTFADCINCSESSFGGPITAALFLENFAKDVPWAHLDIYAWKDSASGAWAENGGSGQSVQALSEALHRIASEYQAEELA